MQTGSGKFWSWFLTGVLTVSIVIVVNLFIDKFRVQADLTDDNRYTLPEAAETIASKLEDTCTITVLMSDPLPSYLDHMPRVVRTRLEEFRAASENKIVFEFVAPEGQSEEYRKDLDERKIQPQGLQDFIEGKAITGSYYLWLTMQYGDQEETFNLLELQRALLSEAEVLRLLPFQIAARLVKMMNPDRQVGVIADKKIPPAELQQAFGKDPTDGLSTVRKRIESHLKAPRDVTVNAGVPVPDDIHSLIVFRPDNLSERSIYEIDQALMRGKNVAILLDNYATIDVDRLVSDYAPAMQSGKVKARPLEHNLGDWLAHFGIHVKDGYVESMAAAEINTPTFQQIQGRLVAVNVLRRYPGIVLATERDADKNLTGQISDESPAFGGLSGVAMAYAVPMDFDPAALAQSHGSDVRGEVVVRTAPGSYTREATGDMLPLWYPAASEPDLPTDRRSYALVVSVEGNFKSFFAGKTYGDADKPPRMGAEGEALPALPTEAPKLEECVEKAHLWVFADSDFASDYTFMRYPQLVGPAQLSQTGLQGLQAAQSGLINVVDALTVGGELVEIRKPNLKDRSLDAVAIEEDRTAIKWKTVALAPAALVVFGILWWVIRGVMTRVPTPKRLRPSTAGPAASMPKERAS